MTMDHSRPDAETLDAEEKEARSEHGADRPPTPDEEHAAEQNDLDPEVASRAKEAAERGAEVEGEGAIE